MDFSTYTILNESTYENSHLTIIIAFGLEKMQNEKVN